VSLSLSPIGIAAAKTLADQAYQRIRSDIMSGALLPGSKLLLEALSRHYNIGMSPLREALNRLASDHLVIAEGQRGFWVASLSIAELDDVTHVRSLIEVEAVQLAIRRGGPDWEENLRQSFAALEEAERRFRIDGELKVWEACNLQFHAALVAACGSPWLIRMQHALYLQSERYRRLSLASIAPNRNVHDEHVAIFEAAIERNVLRACRMTEVHLRNTAQVVRERMREREQISDSTASPHAPAA
jgi:GntR family carbon starvation induced transcriptional regulator